MAGRRGHALRVSALPIEPIQFEVVRKLHHGNHRLQADCFLVRLPDGTPGFWKDFGQRSFLGRRATGRWTIARERRAYERLQGVPGIARLIGAPTELSLLLEYIEGTNLNGPQDEPPLAAFFDRIEATLREMHARGVSHGEVRLENVLRTPGGEPYLIDLATATTTDPDRPGRLFRLQRKLDRYGLLMMKQHLLPEGLSPAEQEEKRRLRRLASILRHNVV